MCSVSTHVCNKSRIFRSWETSACPFSSCPPAFTQSLSADGDLLMKTFQFSQLLWSFLKFQANMIKKSVKWWARDGNLTCLIQRRDWKAPEQLDGCWWDLMSRRSILYFKVWKYYNLLLDCYYWCISLFLCIYLLDLLIIFSQLPSWWSIWFVTEKCQRFLGLNSKIIHLSVTWIKDETSNLHFSEAWEFESSFNLYLFTVG